MPRGQRTEARGGESARRELVLAAGAVALAVGAFFALRGGCDGYVPGGAERFVVPYDAKLDVTQGPRDLDVDGFTLNVSLTPAPPRPLRKLSLVVAAGATPGGDLGMAFEEVEVAFNMRMDMGRHVYALKPSGEAWRAEVVLPACVYGDSVWYGRLRARSADGVHETVFLFDVEG